MGIEMVAGRNFERGRSADSSAYLLNEAAARALGWDEPLGKILDWYEFAGDGLRLGKRGPVIGVVKDFHLNSLHNRIGPVIMQVGAADYHWMISARLPAGGRAEGLASFEKQWRQFTGEASADVRFLDQRLEALYASEQRLGHIVLVFAGLAIFIACLGLFWLAAFTAEERTREIGVRKVLGASVASLVALLSRDFARLVLVAAVVAAPVAYLTMDKWLDRFAYRLEISWWIVVGAAATALVIALATVSYQSIRAATIDPVTAMRYE